MNQSNNTSSNDQSTTAAVHSSSNNNNNNMNLSKSEMEDLREAFRLFDVEGKGVISFQELKDVADTLALENGNKENTSMSGTSFRRLSDLLAGIQRDHNNDDEEMEIDEDGFLRLMSERPNNDHRDEYQCVFDLFDAKGKGFISLSDLRRVSEELGEVMTDEELDEMISKAAPTTGKVTAEDFQRIMTKRLFA